MSHQCHSPAPCKSVLTGECGSTKYTTAVFCGSVSVGVCVRRRVRVRNAWFVSAFVVVVVVVVVGVVVVVVVGVEVVCAVLVAVVSTWLNASCSDDVTVLSTMLNAACISLWTLKKSSAPFSNEHPCTVGPTRVPYLRM